MEATPDAAPKKSKAFPWLIGCTLAVLAVGLFCILGGWFVASTALDKVIEASHTQLAAMIEASQLPEEQIDSMRLDLDRLRDAAIEREIDLERLEGLDREFERTISLGVVQWYEVEVIGSVSFEQEERLDAQRVMERLARGIQEGTLDLDDVDLRVQRDQNTTADGYDVEAVRADVARVRQVVDDNGIPDEPYQVDVAEEFTKLVDGILGQ